MPQKTLYVRESDLPIWEAVEKMIGEKSMSMVVIEALREKLGKPVDGFLNIIRANPGIPLRNSQFAVMFTPVDSPGGAMHPHYCQNVDELKSFLAQLGLTVAATNNIMMELENEYHSNVRLSLLPDKIALIR
jgi:hypothetical protein